MTKVEIATKSIDKEVRPRLQQLSSVKKKFDSCGRFIFRRWSSIQGYKCSHGGNWGPKFAGLEVDLWWTSPCGLFGPPGKFNFLTPVFSRFFYRFEKRIPNQFLLLLKWCKLLITGFILFTYNNIQFMYKEFSFSRCFIWTCIFGKLLRCLLW